MFSFIINPSDIRISLHIRSTLVTGESFTDHTYNTPGIYTAKMFDQNSTEVGSIVVRAFAGTPGLLFDTDPTSGTVPLPVTAYWTGGDTSIGAYTVDFGDGTKVGCENGVNVSNAAAAVLANTRAAPSCSASHTYLSAGNFAVEIIDATGNVLGESDVVVTAAQN
jgi:PKD repeat protein